MAPSRRDFLKHTGCALASAAAFAASLKRFGMISALAQSGAGNYKALVCIFLNGGNDGNNTVIPYDDYNNPGGYSAVRGGSQLAISQASLLQISPISAGGRRFGLHPSMVDMQTLFNQQKLAILCNTGTLLQPLTKSQYQTTPSARPYQLFSHSDQVTQQQSSISNVPGDTGWGGRIADVMLGINGNAPLPMIVSLAGTNLFATGNVTRQLAISPAPTSLGNVLVLNGYSFPPSTDARSRAFDQIRGFDTEHTLVKASGDVYAQALQTAQALSSSSSFEVTTTFPNTTLGNQLKQVARLIKANLNQPALGLQRQVFFCQLGGFDHHSGQINAQSNLLTQVSQAMKAFYDETVAQGVASQVTAFTMSDFGRTFQPAGSGAAAVGSDHAWGNHALIVGGAVRGGDFYGAYPTLALGGPDDTDSGSNPRGRWIPTTSLDQYAATLATWFGLTSAQIPTVFPTIGRFATSNLGFLS
ncbi:MAG TPA: DUF1501 domain-containing protein [Pyrinomonadaceae bacterium]